VDANGNRLSDVWDEKWGVVFRDVVILNGANEKVGTYNLTDHDLFDDEHYGELRNMLVDAAMISQKPWTNHTTIWDVTGDGNVRPVDVLTVINHLNDSGAHKLAPPTTAQITAPYYDVDGDTFVAPKDVLSIINELNRRTNTGGAGAAMASRTAEPPSDSQAALRFLPTSDAQNQILEVTTSSVDVVDSASGLDDPPSLVVPAVNVSSRAVEGVLEPAALFEARQDLGASAASVPADWIVVADAIASDTLVVRAVSLTWSVLA
jgi:hypothetical protein